MRSTSYGIVCIDNIPFFRSKIYKVARRYFAEKIAVFLIIKVTSFIAILIPLVDRKLELPNL